MTGKTQEDSIRTRHWAITNLVSAGLAFNYSSFELVNLQTGRAHQLHFVGGGFSASLGSSSGGSGPDISYERFSTPFPATFEDFNWKGAMINSLNAGIIWGYAFTWLKIYNGRAHVDGELANVSMGGTGPMLPGGNILIHGVTKIVYGAGRRSGTVALLPPDSPPIPLDPRIVKIKEKAMERPAIVLPGDMLFDFDSTQLKLSAKHELKIAAEIISVRIDEQIHIVGHTDSKGGEKYNINLSEKRAKAVRDYLVSLGIPKDKLTVRGLGESKPIESNTLKDGRDNPAGRAKNRRVEIEFH